MTTGAAQLAQSLRAIPRGETPEERRIKPQRMSRRSVEDLDGQGGSRPPAAGRRTPLRRQLSVVKIGAAAEARVSLTKLRDSVRQIAER